MQVNIKATTWKPNFESPEVTANVADIPVVSINMESKIASGQVALGVLDGNENFVNISGGYITMSLTAEQYAEWGTDDDYVVNCLLTNLGLENLGPVVRTPRPVEPEPVVEPAQELKPEPLVEPEQEPAPLVADPV